MQLNIKSCLAAWLFLVAFKQYFYPNTVSFRKAINTITALKLSTSTAPAAQSLAILMLG